MKSELSQAQQELLERLAADDIIIIEEDGWLGGYEPSGGTGRLYKRTVQALANKGILTAHWVDRDTRTSPESTGRRLIAPRRGIQGLWKLSPRGWETAKALGFYVAIGNTFETSEQEE